MIAGPYSTGAKTDADREGSLLAMNRAAYQVFRRGHIPIIGVNLALPVIQAAGPETYETIMMPLSLALADRCDAVLRIGGSSRGLVGTCITASKRSPTFRAPSRPVERSPGGGASPKSSRRLPGPMATCDNRRGRW